MFGSGFSSQAITLPGSLSGHSGEQGFAAAERALDAPAPSGFFSPKLDGLLACPSVVAMLGPMGSAMFTECINEAVHSDTSNSGLCTDLELLDRYPLILVPASKAPPWHSVLQRSPVRGLFVERGPLNVDLGLQSHQIDRETVR